MRKGYGISFLALSALSPATAGLAQQPGSGAVGAIVACRTIADTAARLACFDKTAADLQQAIAQKTLTVLDQEGVRQTKRSLFGFALPSIPLFGRGDEKEQPEFTEINTTVSRVRGLGNGKFAFTLPDGAQWQTTEPSPMEVAAGAKVRIKKGALGSYFLFIEHERPVRARRVG